jgi:hypothetical protein
MLPAGFSREQHRLLVMLSNTTAPSYCPVPLRADVCGLPGALSLTLRVAVIAPLCLGENVTLIVQFAPIAKLVPQLFVCVNWLAFVPPNVMP